MVSAPAFRNVAVGVTKVPLAARSAAVVAGCRGGELTEHGQNSAANVANTEVAAEAQLFQLPFVGSETLG